MGRLDGKRALVTAAAQGIGKASALAMANEGAKVFATDIDAAALEALDHPNIETFVLNVRDQASVEAGAERAQPDILFNCAGLVFHDTVLSAKDDDWDLAFDINVRSMFRTIRACLPGMRERGVGAIVNMSSAASSVIGAPDRFLYGTTKAAVIGMTKSIAIDYIKEGIRCNCICPGTVESPSWHERVVALGKEMGSYDEAMKAFVARQPMGRVAKAEEIAALVVYLSSDESAFTTGQPHIIDGGWSG